MTVKSEGTSTTSPSISLSASSEQESPRWADLVRRIERGEPEAQEELYHTLHRGVRFLLHRRLRGHDVADRVHNVFLVVVTAIQERRLRHPESLLGFVRTVAARQAAEGIREARRTAADVPLDAVLLGADNRCDPEGKRLQDEQDGIVRRALLGLRPRDREVLVRFYLLEQTQEQICHEMGLTSTQYRLLKSRAKSKFSELGRKRLAGRPCPPN
jgi:RNA polymerase sigma-70 factor (ECF subfamily)